MCITEISDLEVVKILFHIHLEGNFHEGWTTLK